MLQGVVKNPIPDQITAMIEATPGAAAKWLENPATGDRYFWPAHLHFHRHVAADLGLVRSQYEKGIAIL